MSNRKDSRSLDVICDRTVTKISLEGQLPETYFQLYSVRNHPDIITFETWVNRLLSATYFAHDY